jgi:hypothetical protein
MLSLSKLFFPIISNIESTGEKPLCKREALNEEGAAKLLPPHKAVVPVLW